MPPQLVFDEVDIANKDPRQAIEFDRKSGVIQLADKARRLLIVGQKLAVGTQAVCVPVEISRENEGEALFGVDSIVDLMIKAAFKANPGAQITAVCEAEAGGAAAGTATVTFATNATADMAAEVWIKGKKITAEILNGNTPTQAGAALVAAAAATPGCVATGVNVAGVVTFTTKGKGLIMNDTSLRARLTKAAGMTVAVSGAKFTGGAGAADFTNALASVAGIRRHEIAVGLDDSAAGIDARDHVNTQGNAENGRGQFAHQAITSTLSACTTLALALNGSRSEVWGLAGSESMYCEIAAACAAVCAAEAIPNRPLDGVEVKGILPPPIEKRWTGTERKTLIANGVSPLVVEDEKVVIRRAVVTFTAGATDYIVLDRGVTAAFDYQRDSQILMFKNRYGRSRWANDDPNAEFPTDVATPEKVKADLLDVDRQLQAEGIVQRVEELAPQRVVNKVGTQCQWSNPTDYIEGLHEIYGKNVLVQSPLGS